MRASAKIIFVPGVKPKPPGDVHRRELLRCLQKGLDRVMPQAAAELRSDAEQFVLYAWNHEAYGEHRDMALDLPGIDRLIQAPEPSVAEITEIERLAGKRRRLTHVLGDRFPALGRLFAPGGMRESLSDARGYLRDIRGLASKIRAGLRQILEDCRDAGERPVIIGHSLGSVIAYDALWELSHERDYGYKVDLLVTLGSPLATRFVSRLIKGVGESGARRYPTIVRRWTNVSMLGETVEMFPRMSEFYSEMLQLGLIERIEDRTGLYNHFRSEDGINVHVSYGYLIHEAVARPIGEAILDVAASLRSRARG